MKKSDVIFVLETLQKMYPDAKTELHYGTPFQLLLAVIMSAQTTDKQVNKVTDILFTKIKTPGDVIAMGYDVYEQAIRSIGLYRSKARNVWKLSQMLVSSSYRQSMQSAFDDPLVTVLYNKYHYCIPSDIGDLMTLPGVGEKTAKVVAHVLYNKAVIAVDTHVHRVCNRLGIVTTSTPLQTSRALEKVIPNHYKRLAHHCLVLFGRYHCTARNSKCEICPLQGMCRYYKRLQRNRVTKSQR